MAGLVFKWETISPQTVDKGVKIYQFKISLPHTDPQVWRRVHIPGDYTIAQFGRAVVKSIGWIPNHWYIFSGPDGELIEDPSRDKFVAVESNKKKGKGKPKEKDATNIKVCELYSMTKNRSMLDMGSDGWVHFIELEKISDPEPRKRYPKCIEGANACPPEDCGGAHGYKNMVKAVGDPKHEEHDDMKEWLVDQGYKKFDPKKFKVTDIRFYD